MHVDARAVRGGTLPIVALVPSRMVASTVIGRELPAVLKAFGESVAPGISQRVAIAESVIERKWIGDYAPSSPGHDDFMALARFVMRATARLRKQTEAP
jgi:cellulose biosynthesis protein BcsQ